MENKRREYEFNLPIGFEDQDGKLHRQAVIRKMTGRDEGILADRSYRGNSPRMITDLLANCLIRLGELPPNRRIAKNLFSADRHFLLVKLREITFGGEMDASYSCPTCREAVTVLEDLSQLEIVRLEEHETVEPIVVELEDGYVDRDGTVYDTMVFRYPTGEDEERIANVVRENVSRGKNALLARCLKAMGDFPQQRLEALGTAIFNDLTLSDRALIDEALNNGPGIRLEKNIECFGCGRSFRASLDMSSFLRPSSAAATA